MQRVVGAQASTRSQFALEARDRPSAERVVADDRFPSDAQRTKHERRKDARSILPEGAVEQHGQSRLVGEQRHRRRCLVA